MTKTSGITILPLDNETFAIGSRDNLGYLDIYDVETCERIYRYTYNETRPTALAKFNGNIYSTTEDGHLYVNYRVSMDITSQGGDISEPEYTLKADFVGLPSDAVVKMKVGNSESVDVTNEISAGKLEKTVPVENGEHEIVLQVIDRTNVVVEDSVLINVNARPQISFDNVSASGNIINFDVENIYSSELDSGIVMALSYDNESMIAKGKFELTDFSGSQTGKTITLDAGIGTNTILFAVTSLTNPKLISDIIYVSGNTSSLEKVTEDGAVSRITGKPNAMQEIDPLTDRFTTAIANDTENECNAVVFIFNDSGKAWDNLAFAYAGKTDANGYKTIEYVINDNPSEGDIYYTTVATGKLTGWKTNSDITKSYWGIDTINQALIAIEGASKETIYTVLTTHPCSSVLRLDFAGEYSQIDTFYQNNVLAAMAGKTFNTPGDVVAKFNELIEEQKIVKTINESNGTVLVNNISTNSGAIGVNFACTKG